MIPTRKVPKYQKKNRSRNSTKDKKYNNQRKKDKKDMQWSIKILYITLNIMQREPH
jgi:hypothetical protein